jgi:ribulose-phosphate 3-epimerase
MMKKIKISPSILAADFGKLNSEIKEIENYSDSLHLDIMDGHFVPNISYGVPVIKWIKTKLPIDCHLMISDPIKYAKDFAQYCDRIFFHAELFEEDPSGLKATINEIKKLNVKVGLVLNPDKSIDLIKHELKNIDAVLIMSVYAGFGGQEFIIDTRDKVKKLRQLGFDKDIVIDGGINKKTAKFAKKAGANVLVAGSAIFGQKDRKKAVDELR